MDPFQAAIFNIGVKKQVQNQKNQMGNKKKELNRQKEVFQKLDDTNQNSATNISKVEVNDLEMPSYKPDTR